MSTDQRLKFNARHPPNDDLTKSNNPTAPNTLYASTNVEPRHRLRCAAHGAAEEEDHDAEPEKRFAAYQVGKTAVERDQRRCWRVGGIDKDGLGSGR